MRTSSRRLMLAAFVILVAGGVLFLILSKLWHRPVPEERCLAVLAWVREAELAPAEVHTLALPGDLADVAADQAVHAERLPDGRLCVLLKTSVGYKDNFEGTLCCDSSIRDEEIYESPSGETISLGSGPPLEELFVRARESATRLRVYFDLN